MRQALLFGCLGLSALAATACEKGLAYGDPNAVIVAAPADWWSEVRDSAFAALAPDVFTLRPERTFRLQYEDPTGPDWPLKRMFKEEVLIGSPERPWIAEALAALDDTVRVEVPGIVTATDVWARGQAVTVLLVDETDDPTGQVLARIGEVHTVLADRFVRGARARMFVSGRNTALADSLMKKAGFSLLLPEVYRWGVQDSLYWFRNDNPDPSELIRQFAVTWRTPPPEGLTTDSLLEWKEALSRDAYTYPQVVERDDLRTRELRRGDQRIFEVRGAWANPPESTWPAAGPFIIWTVHCPAQNRLYFIDAWLYAPGRDKWEYIIQLETILDSFRCGGDRSLAGP